MGKDAAGDDGGGDGASAARKPAELLLGTAVQPLGRKSMGTVWMHHLGADLVAVKWVTLADDPPHSAGYTARQKEGMMLREIEATHMLQHPHIVSLLGVTRLDTPAALPQSKPRNSQHDGDAQAWGSTGTACSSRDMQRGRHSKPAVPGKATFGLVLELCQHGTLQVCFCPCSCWCLCQQ